MILQHYTIITGENIQVNVNGSGVTMWGGVQKRYGTMAKELYMWNNLKKRVVKGKMIVEIGLWDDNGSSKGT